LSRYDEARAQANETLDVARGLQLSLVILRSLLHLGALPLVRSGLEGRRRKPTLVGAARLFGFVEARLSELGVLEELERDYYMDALAVLRGAIDADELTRLMATGASMNEDEAISQAQALQ
jgi:hypothetical protein